MTHRRNGALASFVLALAASCFLSVPARAELITFDDLVNNVGGNGEITGLEYLDQGIIFSTPDLALNVGGSSQSFPNSLGADKFTVNDFDGGVNFQFTEGRVATDLSFGLLNPEFSASAYDANNNLVRTINGTSTPFDQTFDFSGFEVNRVEVTGNFYAIDDISYTLGDPNPQAGLFFLMLPTSLLGDLEGNSPLTLVTLSNNPLGPIDATEWVIPDFGPLSLLQTEIQNGVTPLTLFGGGNIIGASPHVYSDDPTPIDADVQEAIVNGLLAIQTDPAAFIDFLAGQGFVAPDVDLSQPGTAIEGLPPEALLAYFESFDPNMGEDETFRPRLELAVFDGTANILANSSTGEFEVFPHIPLDKVSVIEIVFSDDPKQFDNPMAPTISPQQISQAVVPEPGTVALMGLGLVIGAVVMRRKRRG